jgi:L-fucose mutarotase
VSFPGITVSQLLAAIAPLFEIDDASSEFPVITMDVIPGDTADLGAVESDYRGALGYDGKIQRVERHAFYKVASGAFAIVATGEMRKYGNIILTKGVTPTEE